MIQRKDDDPPVRGLSFYPDNGWLAQIPSTWDDIEALIEVIDGEPPLSTMSTYATWTSRTYRLGKHTITKTYRVIRSQPTPTSNRPQEVQS